MSWCTWTDNNDRRHSVGFEHVLGGLVFVEKETEQALVFSGDNQSWLSPANVRAESEDVPGAESEDVPVPDDVVAWMSMVLHQDDWKPRAYRAQNIFAPWLTLPTLTSSPHKLNLGLIESSLLNHEFKNRLLLVEALTHPSYTSNLTTGDFQRLAVLGERFVAL